MGETQIKYLVLPIFLCLSSRLNFNIKSHDNPN